ncbi:MAG: Fe(3+) ABC transporter substrate-binding protein [Thiohalocapsa sp.]|nr:Fe(3+) ABC transporter substrate-binding protein [Thiohalocapsa sp.]MCF7992001.1 Fe(3+) ABC transporter substrate-binding protein [Thiohalocapsa sp.]
MKARKSTAFPKLALAAAAVATVLSVPGIAAAAEEVNLYSARKEALIKPLLDRFTEETGIEVNLVTGKADALLQRLISEGANSPADLLLTVDAGNLHRAKEAGVTQEIASETLTEAVPATYRDPEGHWVGLSLRARPIMYVEGEVDPAELSTYEDLADPKWKGRICIRSSSNVYNQSLVASMIVADGLADTEQWAQGIVENMARPPQGGDRDQIKAAAAGQCDIAIANTYYLAGMLKSNDPAEQDPAGKIAVFWPNQPGSGNERGTHVNISGAAVTQSAQNKEAAVKLVEFLVSPESQQWYAETNGEYPVREGVEASPVLQAWGDFKADDLNLSSLGELNDAAVRLMDRAGWK